MQDINLIVVTGGLTKDAVVRSTQNGNFYSFSIGFTKRVKDRNGNYQNKSLYRDCSFWSKAGFWADALKKGTKLCVQGEFDTDVYQDQQGNERRKDYIRVTDIQLFHSAKNEQAKKAEPEPEFYFPDEEPTF
jgi:single-strand DNA-binding protein